MLDAQVRMRGGLLASCFGVQMPQNAFDKLFENRGKVIRKSKEKLSAIVKCFGALQTSRLEADGPSVRQVVDMLDRLANFPLSRPFFVNRMFWMAGCQESPEIPSAEVMPFSTGAIARTGAVQAAGLVRRFARYATSK
ncbi:MAG: hypothetical protein WBZ29_03305 [Methanocella sp.]